MSADPTDYGKASVIDGVIAVAEAATAQAYALAEAGRALSELVTHIREQNPDPFEAPRRSTH